MRRDWSSYWQNSSGFFGAGQIWFSAQHSFGWSAISHIGYWSFNRGEVVLEFDMRWSSPVFRQAHSTFQTWLGWILDRFGNTIYRLKGSLVSRVRNQCGITRTYQACLVNEWHICAIGQLHNGGKYLSLFRQRVTKFSG